MSVKTKYHTILWADDDSDDLFMVQEIISFVADDHQVVEAANGREVLNYLNSVGAAAPLPCLIVLDMNMPVLNGKEALAIIRSEEKFNSVPVVVFTTSGSENDRLFCERFGVKMYTKPDTFAAMQQTIGELLSLCGVRSPGHAAFN